MTSPRSNAPEATNKGEDDRKEILRMKKLIAGLAIAGAVLAGGLAAIPAAASSNGSCTASECGTVRNHSLSIEKLTVKRVGGTASLPQGSVAPSGRDWDAFWVPTGRCARFDAQPNPAVYASKICVAPKVPGKWVSIPNDGVVRSVYIYRY